MEKMIKIHLLLSQGTRHESPNCLFYATLLFYRQLKSHPAGLDLITWCRRSPAALSSSLGEFLNKQIPLRSLYTWDHRKLMAQVNKVVISFSIFKNCRVGGCTDVWWAAVDGLWSHTASFSRSTREESCITLTSPATWRTVLLWINHEIGPSEGLWKHWSKNSPDEILTAPDLPTDSWCLLHNYGYLMHRWHENERALEYKGRRAAGV